MTPMDPELDEGRARRSIEDRLSEEAAKFKRVEKHLTAIRGRRKLLARKLLRMGVSEREIGRIAGVTGEAVHYWKQPDDVPPKASHA